MLQCNAEINDYKRLCDAGINIPKMIYVDEKSERIIKEYIEGDLISELVKKGEVKESYITQVRKMAELAFNMDEWSFDNWGIQFWTNPEKLK